MKKLERCKHNKCQRKTDFTDNPYGYCNKCIQLNTEQCIFCKRTDET